MAMKGFLGAAAKKSTDIREFLREASGGNSLKYVAEKDTKHLLYVPFKEEIENVNGEDIQKKSLISISAAVHEWNGTDGKYRSTVCIKDIVREENGVTLNDGSCPFCDRVSDAWEIFNIRKEREEHACGLHGAELEKYMKDVTGTISEERKAKAARDYIYILVAKFRQDKNGAIIINEQTKLPEYDLKVMKLSTSRSEKIQKAVENSGVEMAGTELLFDYPNTEDKRHLSTDCVTVPVIKGTANSIISKYEGLEAQILADANNFDWDGVDKAFPEWKGMTTAEATTITGNLFQKFDAYKLEVQTNPNAKYMEYITSANTKNPSMDTADTNEQAPTTAPAIGTGAPQAPVVDVNAAFGGLGTL